MTLKSFSNIDQASEFADINTSLHHAANLIERNLPPGINLRLELFTLPSLICLPGHLNQLFLISFKMRFWPFQDAGRPGTIKITSAAEDDGITVLLHDDGVGMNEEQKRKPFRLLYNARYWFGGRAWPDDGAKYCAWCIAGRLKLIVFQIKEQRLTLFPNATMTDYASLFTGKTASPQAPATFNITEISFAFG